MSELPVKPRSDTGGVVIRQMCVSDVPAVFEILAESPEAASWSRDSLLQVVSTGIAWVAEHQMEPGITKGEIVRGVLIGQVAADEFEILNLAVAPGCRRRGVGSRLVEVALKFAKIVRCRRTYLEARASNGSAISFYAYHEFTECGRRRGYYRSPDEDAILLSRDLDLIL